MLLPVRTRWHCVRILFTLAMLQAHCRYARSSCIRRLLYGVGELGDADYELECTGVLSRAQIEQEMRNKTDYVVLKLTDCSLESLVDPPAQKSTTVNLEAFEIRNCSIGSWLDRFTFYPEHLLLDRVELSSLDSWLTWHREMQFASTVPFSYTVTRSDALLRAIDTLFPKLAGLTVAPKSLRFDFSHNDLSYWQEETVAQLFSPFANANVADESGEVEVQLEELLLTHANLTHVPRVTATIRGLLNLSNNFIRSATTADFESFTLEDDAVVDLSNNLVYWETIDDALRNFLGNRLIISVQPTTTTSSSTTTVTTKAKSTTLPTTVTTEKPPTTTKTTTKTPVARSTRKRKVSSTPKQTSSTSTATSTSTLTVTSKVLSTLEYKSKMGRSTTQEWTSAAKSMIVLVSDYAQLADGGFGTEQPVESGLLSVTAVIAVSGSCLLITVLAVVGIILFVRRHKVLQTKAKQRAAAAGNAEIDISRWDPENGIITTGADTATNTLLNAQKSARYENQSKSTKKANANGNSLHKKARFDPLLEKIDYVDLSERTTDL